MLIGDDEHGWCDDGVFNFEGGCYAKVIRLSPEAEPEIYECTRRFGTVLENVAIDSEARRLDLDDDSLTENTRACYPLTHLSNVVRSGQAGHPDNVILLTCDAFGVMPPIARLMPEQAMYHFLSGYTARVAGTERGVSEPKTTFSACFGAPFMALPPTVYTNMFGERIRNHHAKCWLVNTGWIVGPYGVGHRIDIASTARSSAPRLPVSLTTYRLARIRSSVCTCPPRARASTRGRCRRGTCGGAPRTTIGPRPNWWPRSGRTRRNSKED